MKKILSILSFVFMSIMWAIGQNVTLTVSIDGKGRVHVYDAKAGQLADATKAVGYPEATSASYTDSNIETSSTTWGVTVYLNEYRLVARAYPTEGHFLSQWKEGNTNKGSDIEISYEDTHETTSILKRKKNINITAYFKEQVVYKDYAHAVAVIVDNNNKPLVENGNYVTGSCFVSIGSGSYGATATMGNKEIIPINSNPSGTWDYTYNVSANTNNYEFLGWYEADANGNLPLTDGKVGTATDGTATSYTKTYPTEILYSNQANAPEAKTMYAVFRPKFFLYPYNAEEDKFEEQPMSNIVVDGVFQYTDRPESYKGGDRLYKIVHRYASLPTVCGYEGDFTAKIEQIQGLDVLRVTPSSNADELTGTVSLCLNGNDEVVQLTVEVTNTPIYVTLNPAVDLLGTYTYTQNTTGAQQFEVTTSPIQKKMTTSSDYAFTFNPTPRDPDKMMFEKWVIRDGEGNVIYESETANLTYRFSGGESIAPVFTSKNRAIFIVKSEPNVRYLKLQEALNRASSLKQSTGQNQVVTVYMTDPPKGQTNAPVRLVQGDYTIANGVTFLIPGESSFAVLEAPSEDNFTTASLSRTCFCSLVVDDNTKITVENGGKISLYALMGADQGGGGRAGKVFNHGHLQLGKDCQITVKTGGFLYALGFITGDMSSHITMKTGSTVYEAFQFKDWRGGSVVMGMMGNSQKVFPVGQYYAQTVEVPMTLEWGAKEYLSTAVSVSGAGLMAANVKFIDTYTKVYDDFDGLGLFALDQGTTLTKSYDPATDRLKIKMEGTGLPTQVKIGHLQLKMKPNSGGIIGGIIGGITGDIDVDSKDYVMPIQNNMDIEVKNATINITSDLAFMPGSVMRVYDDAVINVESGVRMYIYDSDAKVSNNGIGYWGVSNSLVIPLDANARPGGIQYTRTEKDLVDARLIINGDMNIHGELYTVKGPTNIENGAGGDISSEGSGKINVNNIGTDDMTHQWHQSNGAQEVSLTTPYPLILHNDLSKQPEGNKFEYTPVVNENNQNLATNPLSYTYYQHDGTWKLPEAGITGIKLYDSQDNEIEKFLITRPDIASVSGYILVTLEPMVGVNYQVTDFDITSGEYSLNEYAEIDANGKLRIPVTYPVQNIHGDHTQTLRIVSSESAEFSCAIDVVIKATEDYTPIFEVPTSLSIFGRINEPTNGALPIKHDAENVVVVTETSSTNPTNPQWIPVIEGIDKDYFEFSLGEDGNKLDGAKVVFTPNNGTTRNATLKLKAVYTDENGTQIPSEEHSVTLVGNGLMTENTLAFNNIGTITTKTNPFDLLAYINSEGKIYCDIVEGAVNDETDAVIAVEPIDANDVNGNYRITPKKVGQVKIRVYQEGTDTHTAVGMTYNNSTGKWQKVEEIAIEKTIVVVADPGLLTEDNSCIEDEADFQSLTADMQNVEYDGTTNPQIKFTGATSSTWMAQFSNMPGVLTFTPSGDGYWAIQESKDGVDWIETSIWWTQLPSGKPVTVALRPTSRRVQISYIKLTTPGVIEELCIKPFAIHSDVTKIYVPVVDGKVQRTEVVFTHTTPAATISERPTWATAQPTTGNLGGVLNTYYQTTFVLEGGTDVAELNNGYILTVATNGLGVGKEVEASVQISTYDFPKELPMQSSTWVTNPNVANINNYDESEHYYWYMTDAEYVKWDAERKNVVFLNKGNDNGNRSVTFGYEGLPSEVRFQSLSSEWKIEESIDGGQWNEQSVVVTQENGLYTIKQPILHTSKRVRITYIGTDPNEILLSNLVIEGFPSAVAEPTEVEISKGDDPSVIPSATFNIHVMNLDKMQLLLDNTEFEMYYQATNDSWVELDNSDILDSEFSFLAMNKEGDITIKVEWYGTNLVNEGHIQIINPDQSNEVMATVRLVGKKDGITAADANTGIWTGVPTRYTLADNANEDQKIFEPYAYHEVNVQNAFDADGKALFNYMVIYGETTTTDNTTTITTPTKTAGSNAKTPYYIYERDDDGMSYRFVQAVENANSAQKANLSGISHFNVVKEENGAKFYAIKPKPGEPLSFYMTGFCPYATTGSSKDDEGVWYFQGEVGDQLHIYLEDCHLYSRNKSATGQTTAKNDDASPDFTEDYVKGSGGVLVFENANPKQDGQDAFHVSIHTRNHNLLKSNYGCYYTFIGTLQATQISSPVQVRLGHDTHFNTARTELNFDDIWPTLLNQPNSDEHTNGFLSLKKQSNNAPSIDLGNANTVVNFRGGQVQLQNAQVVSPNYKTTLAISYRSGLMGNVKVPMAYGIGTDEVGGTVNFYDGTTTVVPMTVQEEYRGFYLMDQVQDKNEDGTPKVDAHGNPVMVDGTTTTCLRTPTNTYVYGGSHCMMRACNHVTSKGGAPKDGPSGQLLGRYVYNNTNPNQGYTYRCVVDALPTGNLYEQGYREGYELIFEGTRYVVDMDNNSWTPIGPAPFTDPCYIVTPSNFPGNLQYKGASLATYYQSYPDGEYGLSSITPDKDGNLSFWIPEGVVEGVEPEKDKQLSGWKACMTEIEAGAFEVTGRIGGPTSVEFDEEVKNLLYCQLDQNIYNVISEHTVTEENGEEKRTYKYSAPVVDPTGMLSPEEKYMSVPPLHVGDSAQHSIVSREDYIVTNKIYYVTTAMADTWMNFTMPFDVEKIWVVEPYSEAKIEEYFANPTDKKVGESNLEATMRYQARHNADFAAFFGVAMAIGDDAKTFEDIYDGYIDWAKNKADKDNGLYTSGTYDLRGKYPLTHYNGTNFTTSNFYLYKNTQDWTIQDADNSQFTTHWQLVPEVAEGGVLMEKGATYSMLFPYCLGCDIELDENNQIVVDEDGFPILNERDYWDYWSGKFLIFESTKASEKNPHVIKGSNYVEKEKVEGYDWIFDAHPTDVTKAVLTGNSSFAMLDLNGYAKVGSVYSYVANRQTENFYPTEANDKGIYPSITPTATILLNGNSTRAKMITREGRIIYNTDSDENQGTTTGNIPTVGGGNDLFITSTVEGINIAVAEPQHVRVMSATGVLLFNSMVQTAVDVALPTTGVYVITGENEVHKILH